MLYLRMLMCKQMHKDITCFIHKHKTELVILKSKLVLQPAASYVTVRKLS